MSQNYKKVSELSKLKWCIIDVDGTLTDSGIYFDTDGNELKKFSSRDFVGVMAAHYIGVRTMIVTGRECAATKRRADEMKVDYLFQYVKNKKAFIEKFMDENGIETCQLCYIGDDLNDYASMKLAGFKACPADACKEIKEMADYVSFSNGGCGVLQDVFRYILTEIGKWDSFVQDEVSRGY